MEENCQNNPPKESTVTSLIEDNAGGISSIRILMLSWGLGVLLIWLIVTGISLWHGIYVIPTIPTEVVTALLGICGIKAFQRFGEK